MRQLGVVTYLFGDQLGSTSVAFDDAANTTRRQGYTAFGAERYSQGGDLPTRYQYTGQRGFEEIGLYFYNARWYDSYLNRFLSPDSIVPSTGEGNNPNAVGYVASANYSALVVDYHENQFLEQMNRENRNRQGDPNARLPGVPTNPLALDRYAYSLNNPTRYVDPSGHNPIVLALAAIGPVGWVALGVLTVGTVVYFASGGPEAFAEGLTPTIESLSYQVSQGLTTLTNQLTTGVNALLANQRHDENQEALVDLAKEAKQKGGVSEEEAQTLVEWGKEYNVPSRGPEVHLNRNFNQPHIHIGPVGHIPVIPN